MTQKKIGFVLPSIPAYSETFFQNKINGLGERGFKIFLFAKGSHKLKLPVTLVAPWIVPSSWFMRLVMMSLVIPLTFIRASSSVIRLWKLERHDGVNWSGRLKSVYINAHILPYSLDWLYFGFATQTLGRECVAKAIKAKMAVSIRGFDINVYPLKNSDCYHKTWRYIDKLHSLSNYLLSKARDQGLPKATPVAIIPPALDVSNIGVRIRSNIGKHLKILTIARLQWIKGLEYSIEAVRLLKEQGYSIEYIIVGEGIEREKLTFEINEAGLVNQVILVGKKSPEEAFAFLQECDIYLQPSLNEGFCNALLEAQAAGALCIASNVGGLAENVIDEDTGWLVSPRNAGAIVNKIKLIGDLPESQVAQISSNAATYVRGRFLMAQQLDLWEGFYNLNE